MFYGPLQRFRKLVPPGREGSMELFNGNDVLVTLDRFRVDITESLGNFNVI